MNVDLSIILPVYDEVESLPSLWEELAATLDALAFRSEVIFVDDGSTDGSAASLIELARRDRRVRVLRFATHCGLTAALIAGLRAAAGRLIVTMDADLQSDPGDIPRLLRALEGYDAALGWRRHRNDPWLKRVSSWVANGIRTAVLGDRFRDSACTLRAMRQRCRDTLLAYNGMHRFVPTLLTQAGYRIIEVEVNHRPRRYGRSKFGIGNRALRALVDLLAVRWMLARRVSYTIIEDVGGEKAHLTEWGA